jgi:hypothetical protein
MKDHARAQSIYQQIVQSCQLYKTDFAKTVKDAISLPEKSLLGVLKDRSFFNNLRLQLAREVKDTLQLLLLEPPKFLDEKKTIMSNPTYVDETAVQSAVKDMELMKSNPYKIELIVVLNSLLKHYTSKGMISELSDKNLGDSLSILFSQKGLEKLPSSPLWIDILEIVLDNGNLAAFRAICGNKRCQKLPMALLDRMIEKFYVLLAVPSNDINLKATLPVKLNDVVATYVKRSQKLAEHIRSIFNVSAFAGGVKVEQEKKSASEAMREELEKRVGGGGSRPKLDAPGLLEQTKVSEHFEFDSNQAIKQLSRHPGLWLAMQIIWPWRSRALVTSKDTDESVRSEYLVGILNEGDVRSLYELLEQQANDFPRTWRHTDGFRLLLAISLIQAVKEKAMEKNEKAPELKFEHRAWQVAFPKIATVKTIATENALIAMDKFEHTDQPIGLKPESPASLSAPEAVILSTCLGSKGKGLVVPWCPFNRRVDLADIKTRNLPGAPPKVQFSANLKITNLPSEPELVAPHNGYAHELLLWFIRLMREEIDWHHQMAAASALIKTQGSPSGAKKKSLADTLQPLMDQFQLLLQGLADYMNVDADDVAPLTKYAADLFGYYFSLAT